ncbi:hypothetical protein YC2023_108786 [Brassica napus]
MSSKKKQKVSKKSPLPSQYHFIPKTTGPPVPNRRFPPGVSDYPPPRQLFQDSEAQTQAASGPLHQPSLPPLHQPSPPSQSRRSETSATRRSPSRSQSQDSASTESPEAVEPTLSDEQTRLLNQLLSQPNRGTDIPILSPTFEPGTTWFGPDKGKLTRRITKTFTKKFDEAYYSWSVKFEAVCQRHMKDMVSVRRRSRVRPPWIHGELWEQMTAYWDTPEAEKKSQTASDSRLSDRNGLGPHKHNSGQKFFEQIEHEMVEKLGRPVTLGEVFMETHIRKDGTFVDLKADSASNDPQLSIEEDNEIFLLSTFKNERGQHYGIGSLQQTLVNGKRTFSELSSSAFLDMKKLLEDAHRKIEEQAASNAAQAAIIEEQGACIAEKSKQIKEFSIVGKFLAATNPLYNEFVAANSST